MPTRAAKEPSPNVCPSCGDEHAFSIVDEGEVNTYLNARDLNSFPVNPGATYRVYVCGNRGFVVASSEGELLAGPVKKG